MKIIILATLIMLLLSACMGNADEKIEKGNTDGTGSITLEETGITESTLKEFPEYEAFKKRIDLNTYHAQLEEENSGNRIIFFLNDQQEKVYKSVYIKDTNRLKIMDVADDELLFNQVIG